MEEKRIIESTCLFRTLYKLREREYARVCVFQYALEGRPWLISQLQSYEKFKLSLTIGRRVLDKYPNAENSETWL